MVNRQDYEPAWAKTPRGVEDHAAFLAAYDEDLEWLRAHPWMGARVQPLSRAEARHVLRCRGEVANWIRRDHEHHVMQDKEATYRWDDATAGQFWSED